jgi:hypothetical protein
VSLSASERRLFSPTTTSLDAMVVCVCFCKNQNTFIVIAQNPKLTTLIATHCWGNKWKNKLTSQSKFTIPQKQKSKHEEFL